jgi:RNA polymerase sigma factor (sigma-70 family)
MATAQIFIGPIRQLTAAGLPDRQLLERYAGGGDEAAFAALVRRHGPMVLGVCRRVLRDGHAAEDAFQATFLVLARRAGSLRRPEALGPWLHGVAARVALKARAQAARRRAWERQAAVRAPTAAAPEDVAWHDLRPLLDEAVGALPEKLRVPFVLHYLEGETVTAIAGQLGCPRGTVATHLVRARQRLRARLVRRGVTLSAAGLAAVLTRNLAAGAGPPGLPAPLVRAAAVFAAEEAPAGSVPAGIAALAQGGLKTMSLRKGLTIAVVFLLGVGAVSGGTAMLAQAPPAPEQAGARGGAAPASEETDLSLFREAGKRFLAEDYSGADRAFTRLAEEYPDSALAGQARYLAFLAKKCSVAVAEADPDRSSVSDGRRLIQAVLAGARAAAGGQPPGPPQNEERSGGGRDQQKVAELLRRYNACFREGKYKEAETYGLRAQELDPDNATAAAAVQIARSHLRRADGQGAKGREEEIERLLQRPVSLDFRDAPLGEVLDDLRAWHGLNIAVDQPALEQEGVSLKRPVSVHLGNVSLKSALAVLLHDARLTYVVRDGILVVTTPAVARGKPVRATYPVGKLVGRDLRAEALIHLITRTIEPASWDVMGGSGTVEYYPLSRALVVNQTPDVQEQIAGFLADLRRLTDREGED